MLKKIHHAALVCALALVPAPVALAYKEVCFDLRRAGYVATFKWALGKRTNVNGLDPRWNDQNEREGDAIGRIHAHERKCFDLTEVAGPGDRLRFYVQAHAGSRVECGAGDDDREHPGFWLVPDGPAKGTLEFGADGGASLHHSCRRTGGELRMHSECNADIRGMLNAGCEPWIPQVTDKVLHEIVKRDRGLGMLGAALFRGADVNGHSAAHNDNTPLHIVAWKNRVEYGEHLISEGANLNSRNRQGSTPVFIAAHYRKIEALRQLLDAGANPNYPNDLGGFPLHSAAAAGDLEMVNMLLAADAQINAMHAQREDETALEAAKAGGHRAVVQRLLEAGAREEIYGAIVYDIVAEDRGTARLRDALNRGADINARGEGGKTKYLRDLLADEAADMEIQDDQGRTPLMAAVDANADGDGTVRELLNSRADANTAAANGDFPLYVAVRNARRKLINALVFARGTEINQRHAQTGMTALALARDLRRDGGGPDYDAIIRFLEDRGAR